ncbi:hypothetical protein [Xanthobacter agilis]|uniref:Uncharacterized protein n=1 Tax=Xanthobacter agilis TaxID=47492 RepID=A0ABU0LD83_XANAG|nr:hypothetical protein [Xanthobacter agilis]MDQ0505088.1 hypothetical protein [Xanthobacter agilis]
MTIAILSVVTVVALLWMLRVESRLREIFNRLDRQQQFQDGSSDTLQDPARFF